MSRNNHWRFRLMLFFLIVALLPVIGTEISGKSPALVQVSEKTFHDNLHNKDWQMDWSRRTRSVEEVRQYLQKLNKGSEGGWRLPTKEELYELMSIFDLKENGEVKIRFEGSYWLRDEADNFYVGSWEIGDQCEPSRTFFEGRSGHIRAIRP